MCSGWAGITLDLKSVYVIPYYDIVKLMNQNGVSGIFILLLFVLLVGVLYIGKLIFIKPDPQEITITAPPRMEVIDPHEFKGYCYTDECLIKHGSGMGVVGIATITGYYSPYETVLGYGSDKIVKCEAISITDSTPIFKKFVLDQFSSKLISGQMNENGIIKLKISKEKTKNVDWTKIISSNSKKPISMSILIPPPGDRGIGTCESLIEVRQVY